MKKFQGLCREITQILANAAPLMRLTGVEIVESNRDKSLLTFVTSLTYLAQRAVFELDACCALAW